MPRKTKGKNKSSTITIRVNDATIAMLERLAQDFGLNLSETLRAIILIVYIMQYVPDDVRKNWDEYIDRIKELIR